MSNLFDKLEATGIIPVVVINNKEDAMPLAKALCDGGLPCAEVTFRTNAAAESIRIMSDAFPNMLIGAGTILTTEQADNAISSGAKFIVSPGLNPKVVEHCIKKDIPVIPGITNPSDLEKAIELGLSVVKFFPAEAAGGIQMIKALSAPYSGIRFMPTGGITPSNLHTYLSFPKVIACGGSWMVPTTLVESGQFDEITRLTKEAIFSMLNFSVAHVGIPVSSDNDGKNTASAFSNLFNFENKEHEHSIFSSNGIELLKPSSNKTIPHIAIHTNTITRAVSYFKSQGISFQEDSAVYDNNNLKAIYFTETYNGFSIHLLQK